MDAETGFLALVFEGFTLGGLRFAEHLAADCALFFKTSPFLASAAGLRKLEVDGVTREFFETPAQSALVIPALRVLRFTSFVGPHQRDFDPVRVATFIRSSFSRPTLQHASVQFRGFAGRMSHAGAGVPVQKTEGSTVTGKRPLPHPRPPR